MSMYESVFVAFSKLWIVIFGGGYAMLPLLQTEMQTHGWLSTSQLTDSVAVSAMAPGPIATNTAAIVGFKIDGLWGALIASIALTLPSLLVILFIGKILAKVQEHRNFKAAFYGLRPAIIGVIIFAAINFAISNHIIGGRNILDIRSTILMIAAFVILIRTKLHPVYLIIAAALIGIVLSLI
ncbi:chromate transporter [Desulfosporosinus sp. FKB]|uniref:chromate transporter n=1 Tax=Desulfosporosinus sp. FKB TaxID=1969835 RepID=UPI000B499C56|nr:chromate transporter [Desulfosporosinus sp. FKB]